jgi:hypothetical protein
MDMISLQEKQTSLRKSSRIPKIRCDEHRGEAQKISFDADFNQSIFFLIHQVLAQIVVKILWDNHKR